MALLNAVSHRALDGVAFHLDGDLDLQAPFTSAAELHVGGRLVEFTSGSATLGSDVARSLGITDFDSELTFQKGTLRTATTTEREARSGLVERPMLVVWTGKHSSLVTRLYGAGVADALTLLRTVHLAETSAGLTMTPDASGAAAFTRPATVIKEVPGLGLLEMSRRTKEHGAQLPPWKGVRIPSGELFRDTLTDGSTFFVLSGATVWATLVPLTGTPVEQVPDLVGRLQLSCVV
jgi:hypothetical protein